MPDNPVALSIFKDAVELAATTMRFVPPEICDKEGYWEDLSELQRVLVTAECNLDA